MQVHSVAAPEIVRSRNLQSQTIRSQDIPQIGCADEDVSLYSVFLEVKKIPLLKMARTPVGYLSKTALMAVLAQPDITTVKGRRNRMIMILLYDTGTRVQELVDLRVSDFHLDAGTPFDW